MHIFIDESGSFNWTNPNRSIFCGVTVPDRNLDEVLDRFSRWRRSIIGHSNKELKGSELTENQLSSFATRVLPARDREIWLTVVGRDTRLTRESVMCQLRDQTSIMFDQCSRVAGEHGNMKLQETYRQMSGWIKNRSPQNVAWIVILIETIAKSLNHSIVRLAEPEDDEEFKQIEIELDESFIRQEAHLTFWQEWLRADLTKASRGQHLITIKEWKEREHSFLKKYTIYPGLFDLRDLYVNHTGFSRSRDSPGLQIADICAHTILRHHRNDGAEHAYAQLRRRIVARQGAEINIIHFDETSLHKDSPRNHVGILDPEEYKRRADTIRTSKESMSKKG